MAESGFVDLPDTCTVAEALCKYSAHKAWCTRYTNKIEKAQLLLDKQYDRRTDELVAENEVAVLDQITLFLVHNFFEKAKDHQDEVKELEEEIDASWDRYQTYIHARAAAAASQSQQPQDAPLQSKIPNQ